jgi:tetratricopeptide (TPR) repeat protein
MRTSLHILLLSNLIVLFCNGTICTAASSEVPMKLSSHIQLVQFAPSSGWPGTDPSPKHANPPSRPANGLSTQNKVPLPARRTAIDAGPKYNTASPEPLAEQTYLAAQDREPHNDAAVAGQAVKTVTVAAGDDAAWQRCSENTGSSEGAGLARIQACTEILARSPAEPAERRREALKMRAVAYDSLNSDQALGDYAALLTLDPNDMSLLFLRSAHHARRHEYDLAVADLDRIIGAQPMNARAFAARGQVYEQKRI